MKKIVLNEKQINEIINLYNGGVKVREIYYKIGISPCVIERCLLENGFKLATKNKYIVDHTIFNKIDNEEKAYWLGFLFADGHIRKRKKIENYELKLKISIKDKNHLIEFKNFLKSTHPITKAISKVKYPKFISISECVSLSVYSKEIFNDLSDLGCTPNKSKRIEEPKIDSNYYNHFIRGYFDGDGCVSINHKYGRAVTFVSSSYKILEWINIIFNKSGTTLRRISKQENAYRLNWQNKEDIQLIYNFLYENSHIFLERKKEKFKSVLDSYTPIEVIQLNANGAVIKIWEDASITSQHLGINKKSILSCCDKKTSTAGGYKWKYC
jgi:intein-encoded DNA endonuclease-like protein